jgi:hypothetical protein
MIATMAMITNRMLIFFDLPFSLDLANSTLAPSRDQRRGLDFADAKAVRPRTNCNTPFGEGRSDRFTHTVEGGAYTETSGYVSVVVYESMPVALPDRTRRASP